MIVLREQETNGFAYRDVTPEEADMIQFAVWYMRNRAVEDDKTYGNGTPQQWVDLWKAVVVGQKKPPLTRVAL